jgi:predicted O-methyltransferase YrrM
MNAVLEEIIRTGQVMTEDGQPLKRHSGIVHDEGVLLQEIVRAIKPTVSLEVGLAYGVSAMYICDALEKTPNTRHIVIDPYQMSNGARNLCTMDKEVRIFGPEGESWRGVGLHNLKKAGHSDIIDFHGVPSHIALSNLESQGCKVDFAFVDGWHTFDHGLMDFFHIDRILRVGGVIAFDDAEWPSLHKLCRFIVTNRAYTVFRSFDYAGRLSLKRRLLRNTARLIRSFGRLVKPDVIEPALDLGINPYSRIIAFKKEGEDNRPVEHFHDF